MLFLGILFLAIAVYFLFPLTMGVCHVGVFYPAALALLAAARCFFPGLWKRLPKGLRSVLRGGMILCLAVMLAVSLWMASAALNRPDAGSESATVVVLGCRVYDGQPSIMLQRRIDAAYAYLVAHPDAACVPTGGLDGGEQVTEGGCIARTLIAMGIDPRRIYPEEYAFDTAENLLFSADIIAQNGLNPRIVIATDNFHQLRGQLMASRAELQAQSIGCTSPWYLGAGYWCREIVGVLATVVGFR